VENDKYDRSEIYIKLLERQYELNRETIEILQCLKETQKNMNETTKSIDSTLSSIDDVLKVNTQALQATQSFYGKIMWVLVIAVILLAGAEKALKFLG
jgi:hypothetical protein